MSRIATLKVCLHCNQFRKCKSRGLCGSCYVPGIRENYPPDQSRQNVDLTGRTFVRLYVEHFSRIIPKGKKGKQRAWFCRCECGNTLEVPTSALLKGNTKSCGCLKREIVGARLRTHGMCRTPEYGLWCRLRACCTDPTSQDYANYGARGIKVYEAWFNSFEQFIADVGKRPGRGYSLDRIDNDGDYTPGNVRWATQKEQCRNKRSNRLISFNGETKSIVEWAELLGIDQRIIAGRLRRGLTLERVLMQDGRRRSSDSSVRRGSEKGTHYAMLRRCNNPADEAYPQYGGRGISVCDRWQGESGFAHFFADMGCRPTKGHSLERLDVNGDYSPGNCVWADAKTQARNTTRSRRLEYNGETLCIAEWAERLGFPGWLISQRLGRGWTVEEALTTTPKHRS